MKKSLSGPTFERIKVFLEYLEVRGERDRFANPTNAFADAYSYDELQDGRVELAGTVRGLRRRLDQLIPDKRKFIDELLERGEENLAREAQRVFRVNHPRFAPDRSDARIFGPESEISPRKG